ncbi:MAG TPA: ISAs1 family transposase [Candidatus Limnocylindrales bacterium]|nr:ISAs1 family transposase [Candidatus Limnocylindrales bacterium]
MISYSRLIDALGAIPDPRRARGRRFPLPYLLLFSVLAVLSGAKSFTHIVIFMRERREVLNQVFGSTFKTAPSINTVRLLLHAIGGDPLEATVRGYAEHLVTDAAKEALPLIALDGKTLRGSFDHINDRKAVHTLSALAVAGKIVLGHFEVDGKTNEIPCVPALIRQPGLAGVIYTGDAMNCQKETFLAAAETNSSVLAQVKGNQPALLHALEDLTGTRTPTDRCEVKDKIAHGRQERRRVETFNVAGCLGPDWDELVVTAARVTRLTWHKDTKDGMWTASNDSAIYLCQKSLSAADFGAAIRGHWEVGAHHYVRDVTLGEDASRIRINPLNFARLRTIALNILRANGVKNVAQALFRNALNLENILSYKLS